VHDYEKRDVTTTPVGDQTVVRDREAVPAGDGSSDSVEIRDPNRRETT
jgi:hypothetical protein